MTLTLVLLIVKQNLRRGGNGLRGRGWLNMKKNAKFKTEPSRRHPLAVSSKNR